MSLSPQTLIDAVHAYIAAFDQGDAEAVGRLYAEDGVVRDPLDAPAIQGRDAIQSFYENAMATRAKLKLNGPIRTTASVAAFAFSVHLDLPQGAGRIDVIDTFEFNAQGLIQQMTAYWGPINMHGFEEQA